MPTEIASWIIRAAALYLAIGLVFALPFSLRWVDRLDAAARGGSRGFRLLILPGSIALWPVLARRLRAAGRAAGGEIPRRAADGTRLRRNQRRLIAWLTLLLPLGFALALGARPAPPLNPDLPPAQGASGPETGAARGGPDGP